MVSHFEVSDRMVCLPSLGSGDPLTSPRPSRLATVAPMDCGRTPSSRASALTVVGPARSRCTSTEICDGVRSPLEACARSLRLSLPKMSASSSTRAVVATGVSGSALRLIMAEAIPDTKVTCQDKLCSLPSNQAELIGPARSRPSRGYVTGPGCLGRDRAALHGLRGGQLLPGGIRDMDRGEGGALDIAAVAFLGTQLAVLPGDLAARDRHDRRAGAGKAFEHIIFDAAELMSGADGLAARGIPDHEIGVGAHGDRALARKDIEDAGDVRRGDGDELLLGEPSGVDACGPEQRHAVLQPAGAVRDLAEIVDADPLLRPCEGAMVGRDHLQRAGLQAGPQAVLMRLVTERRRHHARRRVVPVLISILAGIE